MRCWMVIGAVAGMSLLGVLLGAADPPQGNNTSGKGVAGNDEVRKYIEGFKGKGAVGDPYSKPLSPQDSLAAFQAGDDLQIQLVAHEPGVRQPLCVNFDERGRLWVVQYLQYPFPAGRKVVKYDQYLRAVFDKVPPPPPHHDRGADKITIHEDTDGDGILDKEKTFLDGLNIATSCVRGRGGVWVLNPPYLLFYPDRDNNDVPDGPPEVRLRGFGIEDTHAVASSLHWGPDGWLYGAQGSTCWATVSSAVSKDVHFKGQAIWRYHPGTEVFEVFAEGGGNTFSCEFDGRGRCFSGTNNGDTRGNHYVQGGCYRKNWGKHGPLTNPHAFGFFLPMQHHESERFSQSLLRYEGGALPDRFHGRIIAPNALHNYVLLTDVQRHGSTFKTTDLGKVVTTTDKWFRPVDIKAGPDGAVYLADWYDTRLTHVDPRDTWDRSNGRIYRLSTKGAAPLKPFDLSKRTTRELVGLLAHENKWFRQTALRLIGDRKDRSVIPLLRKMIETDAGPPVLDALWALNLSGGFNDAVALRTLGHVDPHVRLWTVRLLGDSKKVSPEVARKLPALARDEPEAEVRSQLAATAKRLPGDDALPIVWNLLRRGEDLNDPHIPLLLWWALESKAVSHRDALLKALEEDALWKLPLFQKYFVSRLGQRYTAQRSDANLTTCARLLTLAPGRESVDLLLAGMDEGLAGNPVESVPDVLHKKLSQLWSEGTPNLTLIRVGARLGHAQAAARAVQMVADDRTPEAQRIALLSLFAERREPSLVPALLRVLEGSPSERLRLEALNTLRRYPDPQVADTLLRLFPNLTVPLQDAAQSVLVSRKDWAVRLLRGVDRGTIKPPQVSANSLLSIQRFGDVESDALIKKHWGRLQPSSEEKARQMAAVRELLTKGKGDPLRGKDLYAKTCVKCHRLFGEGGQAGPDLTGYERDNLGFLIPAVVDPNLALREEYISFVVATRDGQVLTGLIVENTPQAVTLVNAEGSRIVVPRKDIEEMAASRVSLMPDGLLDQMPPQEIRDLFAYLQSKAPVKGKGNE